MSIVRACKLCGRLQKKDENSPMRTGTYMTLKQNANAVESSNLWMRKMRRD